jgi:hypothetical protein
LAWIGTTVEQRLHDPGALPQWHISGVGRVVVVAASGCAPRAINARTMVSLPM